MRNISLPRIRSTRLTERDVETLNRLLGAMEHFFSHFVVAPPLIESDYALAVDLSGPSVTLVTDVECVNKVLIVSKATFSLPNTYQNKP